MQFSIVEGSVAQYIVECTMLLSNVLLSTHLRKVLLSTVLFSNAFFITELCSDVSDRGGDPGPGRLKARLLPTVT